MRFTMEATGASVGHRQHPDNSQGYWHFSCDTLARAATQNAYMPKSIYLFIDEALMPLLCGAEKLINISFLGAMMLTTMRCYAASSMRDATHSRLSRIDR